MATLPEEGFVRLTSILGPVGPIPVSRSEWYRGIREGRYPAPVKLSPRVSAWSVDDIRALLKEKNQADSLSPVNQRTVGV